MNNISFNELEFNLYELLNLSMECTTIDVKKTFKKIIKKFHPDKISENEEKLYYNITIANHILSNEDTKLKYDDWLLNSNKSHTTLKNNFKEDLLSTIDYFPKTKKEAMIEFTKASQLLAERHGDYVEDKRNISSIYKEKETIRKHIPEIKQENFSNMKEFNEKFRERKINGVYCDKLVKREVEITPYNFTTNKYVELKNFNNIYVKDSQLNYAFELIPEKEIDIINYSDDMLKNKKLSRMTEIDTSLSLDDIDIEYNLK